MILKPLDIYDHNPSNSCRYSLGCRGKKTLFVFGVNPSTANDVKLDPTVTNVQSFAHLLGYDSFVMLNLYPRRSTDPLNLPQRMHKPHLMQNLKFIRKHLKKGANVWAAWGGPIDLRPYLSLCLYEIYQNTLDLNLKWMQYDSLTKTGHPKHPSRKKIEDRFKTFDIDTYLKWDRARNNF